MRGCLVVAVLSLFLACAGPVVVRGGVISDPAVVIRTTAGPLVSTPAFEKRVLSHNCRVYERLLSVGCEVCLFAPCSDDVVAFPPSLIG
jgi:hypothetical protein